MQRDLLAHGAVLSPERPLKSRNARLCPKRSRHSRLGLHHLAATKALFLIGFAALFASSLMAPFGAIGQDVFKWLDEKGQWKFSNTPPPDPPSPRDAIESLAQPTGSCVPFAMGEARQLKPSALVSNHPYVAPLGFQLKLIDINQQSARFAWRLQVKNWGSRQETIYGNIKLLDCAGFQLSEANLSNTAAASGKVLELSGQISVYGKMADKVGRFTIAVSSTNPPQAPTERIPAYPTYPGSQGYGTGTGYGGFGYGARTGSYVTVVSTQVDGSPGNMYVSGDVLNSGSDVAINIRVRYTVKRQGWTVASGIAAVVPGNLAPGGHGLFRQKLNVPTTETQGYAVTSEAEWSP
ncbi:MAG TPA: DUF4124 domain-containing protein [Candidatus Binatia bacterium]|jgi:hypothetical protein